MTLLRLCPRCPALLPSPGRGPCPDCRKAETRKRGKTASNRGYDAEHKRLSKLAIAAHPFCMDCNATEDLVGDHVVPRSKGGLNVLSNYEVRCRGCNSARGNRESVFLREGQDRDPETPRRDKNLQKTQREMKSRGSSSQSGEISIG
jgi:5-methylcytosine-specific restriction endonuclease McrA